MQQADEFVYNTVMSGLPWQCARCLLQLLQHAKLQSVSVVSYNAAMAGSPWLGGVQVGLKESQISLLNHYF